MSTQQMLILDMWRQSPLTLWHCHDGILCYLLPQNKLNMFFATK